MEVNISYRTRQEILTTTNLAHPDLFNNALNELMQLMKTVGGLTVVSTDVIYHYRSISEVYCVFPF